MKGISVLMFVALATAVSGQADECPPEQENNWEIEMLLRHEDCNKFYKCTFGKPVEYSCYHGLYFNLETWQCDWPDNVDCTGRIDPALTTLAPSPESTLAPTTLAPTTPEPTTQEPTTPAPTTITTTTVAPTTITTTTVAPTTTSRTTLAPTSSHAPECEVEIWPEPETESPATEAPEEEEELEVDFRPNGCPVDPHIHWLLPNEEDCNLFYYCVWGEKELRQCPATLHFNPVLQVCDWPNAAGCTVSANKHAEARRQLIKQILL